MGISSVFQNNLERTFVLPWLRLHMLAWGKDRWKGPIKPYRLFDRVLSLRYVYVTVKVGNSEQNFGLWKFAMNRDRDCVNTVSYTHLDVYKRQLSRSHTFHPNAMQLLFCTFVRWHYSHKTPLLKSFPTFRHIFSTQVVVSIPRFFPHSLHFEGKSFLWCIFLYTINKPPFSVQSTIRSIDTAYVGLYKICPL